MGLVKWFSCAILEVDFFVSLPLLIDLFVVFISFVIWLYWWLYYCFFVFPSFYNLLVLPRTMITVAFNLVLQANFKIQSRNVLYFLLCFTYETYFQVSMPILLSIRKICWHRQSEITALIAQWIKLNTHIWYLSSISEFRMSNAMVMMIIIIKLLQSTSNNYDLVCLLNSHLYAAEQ